MPKLNLPVVILSLGSFFMITFTSAFSQEMIGLYKNYARYKVKTIYRSPSYQKSLVHETDSSLSVAIREPHLNPMDLHYSFNPNGECIREDLTSTSSVCLQEQWQQILQKTKFGWVRINEDTYISSFGKKRVLERLPGYGEVNHIRISRVKWNRETYRKMAKG